MEKMTRASLVDQHPQSQSSAVPASAPPASVRGLLETRRPEGGKTAIIAAVPQAECNSKASLQAAHPKAAEKHGTRTGKEITHPDRHFLPLSAPVVRH